MERSSTRGHQHGKQREMEPALNHLSCDPAASLANMLSKIPALVPDLKSGNPSAQDVAYYSTTKGADFAISCFEIVSFILIITLYLPG